MQLTPPELTSPQQALDVGYLEGAERRANCTQVGVTTDEGNLADHREIAYEDPYRFERIQSQFYSQWRIGFDAGLLTRPKPAL